MFNFLLGVPFLLQAAPINFIAPEQISSPGFAIASSGLYVLTDDVEYAAGETAITIAADHVTLDLNGKNIQSSDGGKTGILVSATKKNVIIKNGGVSGFSSNNIRVEAGANNLSFSNLILTGPKNGSADGLQLVGEVASPIYEVTLENCRASSFDRGVYASHAHEVKVVNSTFNFNHKVGIEAYASQNWRVTKCQASHQNGTGATAGILCTGGKSWLLQDSDFSSNIGAAGYGAIFNADAGFAGGSHEIVSCNFSNNGGLLARGLDLLGANVCVVRNCSFNGNFATKNAARGLNITGVGHYIEHCIADGNYATTTEPFAATGMVIAGSAHTVDGCHVAGNVSKNGLGIGILNFASTERCLIKNCTAVSNSTSGFQDDSKAGANLWIGNMAWGHGEKNYVGAGPGFIEFTAGKQPASGTFDERGVDNISVR